LPYSSSIGCAVNFAIAQLSCIIYIIVAVVAVVVFVVVGVVVTHTLAYLLTDAAAAIFNNMKSIRIGGKHNAKNEIVDHFRGIIAGMFMQTVL